MHLLNWFKLCVSFSYKLLCLILGVIYHVFKYSVYTYTIIFKYCYTVFGLNYLYWLSKLKWASLKSSFIFTRYIILHLLSNEINKPLTAIKLSFYLNIFDDVKCGTIEQPGFVHQCKTEIQRVLTYSSYTLSTKVPEESS